MRRVIISLLAVALTAGTVWAEEKLLTAPATKKVTLTGYSRGRTTMKVSSEVSGKVLAVNYDIGDRAGKNPFVQLDPTLLDFGIDETEAAIGKTEVSLGMSESRVAYLKKEYERIDALHKGDRATGVRRDAAKQEFDQAALAMDSLEVELGRLKTKLAELQERRDRLSIHVPRGWVLTARDVEPGEFVMPGVSLGEASDFSRLVVPLAVSAYELEALRLLRGEFPAVLEAKRVKARLRKVNPRFDEATRKYSVELQVLDYGGPKRGGLSFNVDIEVRADGVMLPKAAVLSRYDNPRVKVKSTGETVYIIIIGEHDGHFSAAFDERIKPGTELERLTQ